VKQQLLRHEFVEQFPDQPTDGTVYVSMLFASAMHLCCCGCGNRVVTPLSPSGWTLTFDGRTISLDPSIGNWSFPCQSHYWIVKDRTDWSRRWSRGEIVEGRDRDQSAADVAARPKRSGGLWRKLRVWR